MLMGRKPLARRWPFWVAVTLALMLLAALAWYFLSPLVIDKTVNEEFPRSTRADVPAEMSREEVEKELAEAEKTDKPMSEGMPAEMDSSMKVATGQFKDVDSFHKGSGQATIYRTGEDQILRLENLDVTNGPDLYVYFSGHPAPSTAAQLHEGGDLEVGRLKGNKGNQNYELPADVDTTKYKSVVVYCKRFSVVFSTAELAGGS